jgi:hypothetical protein
MPRQRRRPRLSAGAVQPRQSLREQNRLANAFERYRRPLPLNPGYADPYFTIALLCERTGDALGVVNHWKSYRRLDSSGHRRKSRGGNSSGCCETVVR